MSDEASKSVPDDTTSTALPSAQLEPTGDAATAAMQSELATLLGKVRAALADAENARSSAAKAATEAELARKSAVEHEAATLARLNAASASADGAAAAAKTAQERAAEAATRSEHIQEGVKHADESRKLIEAGATSTVEAKCRAETAATEAANVREELAGVLTDIEAKRTELAGLKGESEAIHQAIVDALAASAKAQESAEAAKDAAVASAEESKTRCEHVNDGEAYITAERARVATFASQAEALAGTAGDSETAAKTSAEEAENQRKAAVTAREEAARLRDEVKAAVDVAAAHTAQTKRLAAASNEIEQRVAAYEAQLAEMRATSLALERKIESLLPGATSAGLASAFAERSKKFRRPEWIWQGVFIVTMLALIGLAAWELKTLGDGGKVPEYSELLRLLAVRLPFAIPLVWLAIHAGRQASLCKRLEEEYGFKATTSMSFEGFRKLMMEMGADVTPSSPGGRLCIDTLRNIATPPGRIYEKSRPDPTPGTALAESVGPIADAASKVVKPAAPN